ncbi:hypothetical protein BGZ92_002595, partial [Podila epicladia]
TLKIFSSIHLVAISVANSFLAEDLMERRQGHVDLVQKLNGTIVFVHTKVDHAGLHPQDETVASLCKMKCAS